MRRRYRFLADWKLQGNFCLRISFYWLACQVALVATILGFLALEGQPRVGEGSPWSFIVPAIVASSLLLPIVLLDIMRFSNRFAGPLVRLRKSMQMLAEGKSVTELHFRPGDYLNELSTQFNEIRARIEHLEKLESDRSNEDHNNCLNRQFTTVGRSE